MDELKKNLFKDETSRNRIVSETDKNFFVEAGAGSGKTTMLVNRMVAMVEQGKDIRQICAITFTKAAAGEFYDRFQKMLIERSNPEYLWENKGFAGQLPRPTGETRKRCAEALKNIDLCFMGTIDAFCNLILSEHPSEAKIPSDAVHIDEDEEHSFYRQMFASISNGAYGEELKKLANIFQKSHSNAEVAFVSGIANLMDKRNVQFNYNKRLLVELDEFFNPEKEELLATIECLLNNPDLKQIKTKDSEKAWEKLPNLYLTLKKDWWDSLDDVRGKLDTFAKIRTLPEIPKENEQLFEHLFELCGKKSNWLEVKSDWQNRLLGKIKEMKYSLSMNFFEKCIPVLEQEMRTKGCLTYFDCLYYLRNMLKEDAAKDGKLIKYISKKHKYFLIDEFQDTNPMQAEVFFYLASDNPIEIWSDCIPRSGALFIVGDPKQSIYRFRSADVTSFFKVRNLFTESVGDILSLSRNFRSTKPLLEYYNRVFTQLLPEENEYQSKFEEIPLPDGDKKEFRGIFSYEASFAGKTSNQTEASDPVQITNIIEALVDREQYLISEDNGEKLRKIRYSDIMVITKKKEELRPIMQTMRASGIPMKVEGHVTFDSNEALGEIYLIYAAVADKNDKMALYGALTGRLINLLPSEILNFKNSGGRLSLEQVKKKVLNTDETSEITNAETADETANNTADETADNTADETNPLTTKVKKKIDELRELSNRARKLSPAALFAEIMDTYEVFMNVSTDNLEVLYYTLELLRKSENSGLIVSAKDGADYIKGLIAGNSKEERCLSLKDNRDSVHMANLHKVKGLEAPIVILAAADDKEHTASKRIEYTENSPEGYIFAFKNGFIKFLETNEYSDKQEKENGVMNAEGSRLVYVAATRAKNALIICNVIDDASGEILNSKWTPIIEEDMPLFFNEIKKPEGVEKKTCESVNPKDLYDKAREECVLKERTSETATFELKNPSKERVPSKTKNDTSQLVATADVADVVDVVDIEEEAVLPGEAKSDGETTEEAKEEKASKNKTIAATRGTMVHRLMEVIISTRAAGNPADVIDEIIREYRTPESLPYEEEFAATLMSVAKTMLSGGYPQENHIPNDIVKELLSAEECHTEVPFCYKEKDGDNVIIWNGIMDVVYKKDGAWQIIDYKTNADGSHLDDKYRGQLNAYVKAFEETTGWNVADAHTYHIGV